MVAADHLQGLREVLPQTGGACRADPHRQSESQGEPRQVCRDGHNVIDYEAHLR